MKLVIKSLYGLIVFIGSVVTVAAQTPSPDAMPVLSASCDLDPLRACLNDDLQINLESVINSNAKWKKLASQKKLALGLVDLRDINQVRYAQINGDEMMYAASLPKIAILLAAMDALEKKELMETKEVRRDLHLMISKSDNQASTRMIDRLGYEKIEAVLTSPDYQLYNIENGGGLWVGKRYAAGGKRNPEPLKGLSHAATPFQICRFYYLMFQGKLVSEERSRDMMTCMTNPGLHHKFVNTLDQVAPKAKLFRKSGSWKTYHADSVLVWGPKRKYILTALVNDPEGEGIMRQLVAKAEKALDMKYMAQK